MGRAPLEGARMAAVNRVVILRPSVPISYFSAVGAACRVVWSIENPVF